MLDSEGHRQPDADNAPDVANEQPPAEDRSDTGVSRLAALSSRFWQRRYRMAGAAGIVAALGTAALVAGQMNSAGTTATMTEATVPNAPAAASPSVTAGASASPTPSPTGTPAIKVSAGASPHRVPPVAAAPRRPSPTPTIAVTVTTYGTLAADHHSLRVISAHTNLTGQRELAWVADNGQPVGDARCTQNFRFTPGAPAVVRPTMMICWRTSASKSVFTIAVDLTQPPSAQASVAELDKTWSAMH